METPFKRPWTRILQLACSTIVMTVSARAEDYGGVYAGINLSALASVVLSVWICRSLYKKQRKKSVWIALPFWVVLFFFLFIGILLLAAQILG